jgi:hypothetical protein
MVAPVVTVHAPPPLRYPAPGIVRPEAIAAWSGATGPTVDVLHEWDDDSGFGSPITDLNAGISGGAGTDVGVPPSDLGPAGTDWFYRVTVTDNDDSASTTSASFTLVFEDPIVPRRYLYEVLVNGVGFDPIDTPAGGWGPDPDPAGGAPDGFAIVPRRYLYEVLVNGVGFDPIDTPAGGWGPEPGSAGGDGFAIDFRRYLYELLGDVDTTTPVPHIWYLFPTFGREGWEFKIVGYGFGDTAGEFTGTARLNALAVGIITWQGFAEVGLGMEIDPAIDLANPVHQEVRATVPTGGVSGLVFVETDDV